MKDISFEIGQKQDNVVLVFASEQNGKALIFVLCIKRAC